MLRISAIIPTHNRAELLKSCLESLLRQTLAPDMYEICVVNNCSSDNTSSVVRELANQYPNHRVFCIDEPVLGLSRARNCGLNNTHAPFVAYGDDDAVMEEDWLERFVKRFDSLEPSTVKIGGEVIPVWGAPRPTWMSDGMLPLLSASSGLCGKEPSFCESHQTLMEGNCCYRREALTEIGGFSSLLGRKGGKLLSGDGLIDLRMAAKGKKFFFDPGIIIHHHIHADRLTPNWIRRRYFWQGVADFAARTYFQKYGLPLTSKINLDIPLSTTDWAFVNSPEAGENFEITLSKLRGLGFVMAMTGIIPINDE